MHARQAGSFAQLITSSLQLPNMQSRVSGLESFPMPVTRGIVVTYLFFGGGRGWEGGRKAKRRGNINRNVSCLVEKRMRDSSGKTLSSDKALQFSEDMKGAVCQPPQLSCSSRTDPHKTKRRKVSARTSRRTRSLHPFSKTPSSRPTEEQELHPPRPAEQAAGFVVLTSRPAQATKRSGPPRNSSRRSP